MPGPVVAAQLLQTHYFPRMLHLRRRLANATAAAVSNATNATASANATTASLSSTSASGSGSEEEDQSFDNSQIVTLHVSGYLAVSLYLMLAAVILWMAIQHFRHESSGRKRAFHLLLLTSVLLNVPDPLGWLLWPDTESWVYTYPMRIYSLLLQSVCKSIISIAWSEVVSAGQSHERRRVTYLVRVFNAILLLWGVSVPFLLAKYPDDVYGQYDFMQSTLRAVVTYSGVGVIFVYGIILTFQGMRLRRRLLQAKGTVPIASVEKSLSQLMLTVYVIVFSDVMRIGSLILNELNVDMPFITFLVCNNLIPNIFPTICMLYLMRRYTKKDSGNNTKQSSVQDPAVRKQQPPHHQQQQPRRLPPRGADATLSRFMTDDRESDLASAPVLGMSKFTLPHSRVASVDRVDLAPHHPSRHHPHVETTHAHIDSRGSHSSLSPTSHWMRE